MDAHHYPQMPNFFTFSCSNKIEVSYQEAVALKRQEELIREEEAAWLVESEQKAKRGAAEKEKKLKKKQVCYPNFHLVRLSLRLLLSPHV